MEQAKLKKLTHDREVAAAMEKLGLNSAGKVELRREMITSGSRLATFVSSSHAQGSVVQVSDDAEEKHSRSKAAKRAASSSGTATPRKQTGTGRQAKAAKKEEGSDGNIVFCCQDDDDGAEEPGSATKERASPGLGVGSASKYYQHKDISIEDVLQGKKSQGQKTAPARASIAVCIAEHTPCCLHELHCHQTHTHAHISVDHSMSLARDRFLIGHRRPRLDWNQVCCGSVVFRLLFRGR
jgi:hypothetical protein